MRRRYRKEDPQRILVIRFSAIGDVLLTTPLLRVLKARFPNGVVDFLVKESYVDLIKNNAYLCHILLLSSKKKMSEIIDLIQQIRNRKYDIVIDLQGNFLSFFLCLLSGIHYKVRYTPGRWRRFLLVYLGLDLYRNILAVPLKYIKTVSDWEVDDDGLGAELIIDRQAERSVENRLIGLHMEGKGQIIVIAPGAGRATKRWPARKFAKVGDYFQGKGCHVILVGGRADQEVSMEVIRNMKNPVCDFTGKLSLQETAALLNKASLLVTNDTGIMHMGAALMKRVVAIFGPTTKHFGFFPFRTITEVVERELSCRPCSYHGTDRCPKHHFLCMEDIRSDMVIETAEKLLQKD